MILHWCLWNGVSALYHIRYTVPRNYLSRGKLSDKFSIHSINMKETRLKNLRSFKSFHHKMWEMVNSCTWLLVKLFDTSSLLSWAIMLGLVLRLKKSQSLPPSSWVTKLNGLSIIEFPFTDNLLWKPFKKTCT